MTTISTGWGGCGNLINNILHSPGNEDLITKYYEKILVNQSWSDQEFSSGPRPWFDNVVHEFDHSHLMVGCSNSAHCTYHFLTKNPKVTQLKGTLAVKHAQLLGQNRKLENRFKRTEYWNIEHLLQDKDALYLKCALVNPEVEQDTVLHIVKLWQQRSRDFYKRNGKRVLKKFRETVPEYDPQVFLKAIDYNDSMV